MEARRRQTKVADDSIKVSDDSIKVSDDVPLPIYLMNVVFFTVFFSVVYFLLLRWREKIRNSTPLHDVTLSEMAAVVTFFASFVYLLGFFGIGFVQSLIIPRSAHEDIIDDEDEISDYDRLMVKEDSPKIPCAAAPESDDLKIASPKFSAKPIEVITNEDDEEIVNSVVEGKIPSYALESKLGDCRREALQRTTGKSLEGLPLEGFDYDSILGQCCEMLKEK